MLLLKTNNHNRCESLLGSLHFKDCYDGLLLQSSISCCALRADEAVVFVGLYCFLKISPLAVHTRRLIMEFIFTK